VCAVPKVVASGSESCYRRADIWQPNYFCSPSVGLLTPDVTQRWLALRLGDETVGASFAVELKPKQAGKTRSWLIEPSRALLKSEFSRIRITRAAKGGFARAMATFDSDYHALFDNHRKSMRQTIESGLRHQAGPVVGCFIQGERVSVHDQPSLVAAVVTGALGQEQILQRLQTAQKEFDCLDVDGIGILLAAPQLANLDIKTLLACRSVGSKLSEKAKAAARLCCCPPGVFLKMTPNAREECREKAVYAINKLDVADLVDLLHNWLIALMLDDVSIIVSAARLESPVSCRSQTQDHAGVVRLSASESYVYAIAVVDACPKSISKLKEKSDDEEWNCTRANTSLGPGVKLSQVKSS